MIHLDYLLVIGILLSILLFLLVGAFYYSKSNLLKGVNIWFLIILSALLSYLLYPLYELTDYRGRMLSGSYSYASNYSTPFKRIEFYGIFKKQK